MHPNANISYLKQEEHQIMEDLVLLQPKEVTGARNSAQEVVLDMINGILERKDVPDLLDTVNAQKDLFQVNEKNLMASLSTFLLQ